MGTEFMQTAACYLDNCIIADMRWKFDGRLVFEATADMIVYSYDIIILFLK